jgi:hypothetical protein
MMLLNKQQKGTYSSSFKVILLFLHIPEEAGKMAI